MNVNRPDLPLNGARCLGTLTVNRQPDIDDSGILAALNSPVWAPHRAEAGMAAPTVFSTIKPGESLCIVVSDQTRKTAADRILPVLVNGLIAAGCAPTDMFILVASGIHRHPSQGELTDILGRQMTNLFSGRIWLHDPDDESNLVTVGRTSRNHPVRLNRRAVEADRLALIGTVVFHYHAGFGGGKKSLVPGLAARETIAHNHSLTLDPEQDRIHSRVGPGILDGNPVAEEMLEGARLVNPSFIVNSVLMPDGALAGVFAGDLDFAHRAACRFAERAYRCDIPEPADLVIASAAAASNWIQAHKALFNADRAVRPDGRIILNAPCQEGLGNERFRHWIRMPLLKDIFYGLRDMPEVLGQTALSTRIRGERTILVTQMPATDIADLGIETAPDLNSAIERASACLKANDREPTYYLMPEASYTLPFIR